MHVFEKTLRIWRFRGKSSKPRKIRSKDHVFRPTSLHSSTSSSACRCTTMHPLVRVLGLVICFPMARFEAFSTNSKLHRDFSKTDLLRILLTVQKFILNSSFWLLTRRRNIAKASYRSIRKRSTSSTNWEVLPFYPFGMEKSLGLARL